MSGDPLRIDIWPFQLWSHPSDRSPSRSLGPRSLAPRLLARPLALPLARSLAHPLARLSLAPRPSPPRSLARPSLAPRSLTAAGTTCLLYCRDKNSVLQCGVKSLKRSLAHNHWRRAATLGDAALCPGLCITIVHVNSPIQRRATVAFDDATAIRHLGLTARTQSRQRIPSRAPRVQSSNLHRVFVVVPKLA